MKLSLVSFVFATALLCFMSCSLEPSERPLPPVMDSQPVLNEFKISISSESLGVIFNALYQIRIRVFEGNTVGNESSNPREVIFDINEDGIYAIDQLRTGPHKFVIQLLDDNLNTLAEAERLVDIGLGAQTLDKVVFRPTVETIVPVKLDVNLNLLNFPGLESEAISMLETYSCQGCHNEASPLAGFSMGPPINSQRFPKESQFAELLQLMIGRMSDPDNPMPPAYMGQTVSDQDLQLMSRWVSEVEGVNPWRATRIKINFLESSETVAADLVDDKWSVAKAFELIVGKSYQVQFVAEATDDLILDTWESSIIVDFDGILSISRDIEYRPPSVEIPIQIIVGDN